VPRAGLATWILLLAGLGSSAATAAPAAPDLRVADEALDRAVHLAWGGGEAAGYELQRRRESAGAWTDWQTVRQGGRGVSHVDDRGVDDAGLAPGYYAYRLRTRRDGDGEVLWSGWSDERRVRLHPQCEAPVEEGLPTITAADADGDGRLTGRDLERALRSCSARGGCVLELLPETYSDVAVLLYDGNRYACTPSRTSCLKLDFPKGLVLQGHGDASVLRSPLWKTPYQPMPVLEIWNRPDIRLALRNLVLDGRKQEQGAPRKGINDSVGWWHYGFSSWNYWGDHSRRNRGGCLHNLTVRNFMSRGISIADADDWVIERSRIDQIGCHDGISPCPALGIPHTSRDPALKSTGNGIEIGWYVDDIRIEHNRIRGAVKYSLSLKHGSDGLTRSIRRPRIWGNEILDTGQIGIFLAGVQDGLFGQNVIERTSVGDEPLELATFNDTFGISCAAAVSGTRFERNSIREASGIGVGWSCSGAGNAFVGNELVADCRQKNPRRCVPSSGRCYDYAGDFNAVGTSGDLAFVDNEILDSKCAMPLRVEIGEDADFRMEIRGGRMTRGPLVKRPVRFQGAEVLVHGGARFEDLDLEFARRARGVLAPSVHVGPGRSIGNQAGSRVLLCPREPKACQRRCALPSPPTWCEELLLPGSGTPAR
jgi:hypothetical protein